MCLLPPSNAFGQTGPPLSLAAIGMYLGLPSHRVPIFSGLLGLGHGLGTAVCHCHEVDGLSTVDCQIPLVLCLPSSPVFKITFNKDLNGQNAISLLYNKAAFTVWKKHIVQSVLKRAREALSLGLLLAIPDQGSTDSRYCSGYPGPGPNFSPYFCRPCLLHLDTKWEVFNIFRVYILYEWTSLSTAIESD